MKTLPFLVLAVMSGASLAQDVPPAPKKDPFAGFGNALDRIPSGPHSAKAASPAPFVSSLPPKTGVTGIGIAVNNSITFDAKTVSNGGGIVAVATPPPRGVVAGGRVETRVSHPVLEVNVRNMSAAPADAHFDWFFIATTLEGRRRCVWDQGERDVALPARGNQVERLESTEIAQQTINRTTLTQTNYTDGSSESRLNSTQTRTGERPDGWIVRMFVGGALVKVQASTDYYEQIGRNPTQLEALLGKKGPQLQPIPH